jgi:hypothetical protein
MYIIECATLKSQKREAKFTVHGLRINLQAQAGNGIRDQRYKDNSRVGLLSAFLPQRANFILLGFSIVVMCITLHSE